MTILRSVIFYLGLFPATVLFCLIGVLVLPLPRRKRYFIVTRWSKFALWRLRISCGLRSKVSGTENIPEYPCVIFCKHQSAWETMALQFIFPPHVQVVKRELLYVPFFGWGLASLNPIAIDRRSGAKALRQVLRIGTERIREGWCVLLFPEGTRTRPGDKVDYSPSAAALAIRAGCSLIPVAHNAGVFWSRNAIHKFAGQIEMRIGPEIPCDGRSAAELTLQAQAWVEQQCDLLAQTPLR
jgi:1-acyl-sn-glycerol-3-phosphate acyltransferase